MSAIRAINKWVKCCKCMSKSIHKKVKVQANSTIAVAIATVQLTGNVVGTCTTRHACMRETREGAYLYLILYVVNCNERLVGREVGRPFTVLSCSQGS